MDKLWTQRFEERQGEGSEYIIYESIRRYILNITRNEKVKERERELKNMQIIPSLL
jgi:hypothetical protein